MERRALIIIDTHIWIWWVHGDPQLPTHFAASRQQNQGQGLGVSAISCWEVAKLVERGRITLPVNVNQWMNQALAYPGVSLLPLSPEIAVESTQLPGSFHRDPADQIIVAAARILNCLLMTLDTNIRAYPHVQLAI